MRSLHRPATSLFLSAALLGGASLGAGCGGDDEGSAIDAPASSADARASADAAPPVDAAVDATVDAFVAPVNGCTPALAEDHSGAADPRQIDFGGIEYTPRCMRINVNQAATFVGDLVTHPLRAGVIDMGVATEDPTSVITATSLGNAAVFTFTTAGAYPYYCQNHIAVNMSGVIYVQ